MTSTPKQTTASKETRRIVLPYGSKIEIRKNADGSRSITGEAVVYNSLSEDLGFREVIKPGTFTQSLKDNPDVLCLYGHDDNQILGRVASGTLSIQDTATALRFTCTLPNTTTANDLIALMERGDISAMSFGFVVDEDEWQDAGEYLLRTVTQAQLFEISVVGQPAYKATSVNLRSVPKHLLSKLRARAKKTKSVDSVELPASSFAYVGDTNDISTWHLPIDFPGDEQKTVNHIKDALARFDQTEGIPDSEKAKVYHKIVAAAKAHGITVAKETYGRSRKTTGAMSEQDADAFLKWASDDDGSSDSDSPVNADDDGADSDDTDDLDGDSEDECRCLCANCQAGECRRCNTAECEDDACRAAMCPMQQRSFHQHLLKLRSR